MKVASDHAQESIARLATEGNDVDATTASKFECGERVIGSGEIVARNVRHTCAE